VRATVCSRNANSQNAWESPREQLTIGNDVGAFAISKLDEAAAIGGQTFSKSSARTALTEAFAMNAPRGGGVLRHTPVSEKLGLTQDNSGSAIVQHVCAHKSTVTQQEPLGRTHYSREICLSCRAFVRWLPKPSTIERRTLNAFKLARLAMRPDLTGWERQFICSVSGKKHLSPKQERLLVRLYATYLEGKPS
jgi:hypothetical protein